MLKEYDGLIKQETILQEFTDFINTKILGKGKNRKSNWKLPSGPSGSSKGKKSIAEYQVGEISFQNRVGRKMINSFEALAKELLHGESYDKWINCITKWKKIVNLMRKKEDFTDDEIDNFSSECDDFF